MSDDERTSLRLDRARTLMLRIGSGNLEEAVEFFTDDVVYHVGGDHSLSGEFVGKEATCQHLQQVVGQTAGRFDPVKWEDWLIGLHHVAAIVDVHVEVHGARRILQHLFVVRFTIDDLIDRVTVFFTDPDAPDRIFLRPGEESPDAT